MSKRLYHGTITKDGQPLTNAKAHPDLRVDLNDPRRTIAYDRAIDAAVLADKGVPKRVRHRYSLQVRLPNQTTTQEIYTPQEPADQRKRRTGWF